MPPFPSAPLASRRTALRRLAVRLLCACGLVGAAAGVRCASVPSAVDACPAHFVAPLDDAALSRQRGGRAGFVATAAATAAFGNTEVTLWDEVAPPQAPQPADAAHAAQDNRVHVDYARH